MGEKGNFMFKSSLVLFVSFVFFGMLLLFDVVFVDVAVVLIFYCFVFIETNNCHSSQELCIGCQCINYRAWTMPNYSL